MAEYAVIKDGIIINIIVADSKEIAEQCSGLSCAEYDNTSRVRIGWSYDGTNFSAPVSTEETPK